MEIVDGQHRLQAAIELNLPIFYMIDDKITKAEIALVNSNRKSWGPGDYMEYFAREGNDAYKKALKLIKEYPITKLVACNLITDNAKEGNSTRGFSTSMLIKEGSINANDYDLAIKICKCAEKIFNHHNWAYDRDCIIRIKKLVLTTSLEVDETLRRVSATKGYNDLDGFITMLDAIRNTYPKKSEPVKRPVEKPKVDLKKVQSLEPPKRKEYFKKGKEVLDSKDFKEFY